ELTGRYGQPERPVQQRWTKKVAVGSAAPSAGSTLLYVSANPDGTSSTYAAAEARQIRRELARNPEFRMEERGAIGPTELSDGLLNLRPRIVHLAGHGEDGHLYLEHEMGQAHIVSPRSVAGLFSEATDYVECVVVGACDSEPLAKAVCEYIDYVIAVDGRLHSSVAVAFSVGFYQALAAGETIEKAYRLGHKHVPLQLGDDFADQPVRLYMRRAGGANAGPC
ncbi:MAG TPA: CHAT domain-containing protein, partial [Pseudonocardiaceae bacterium]|nr:CHAT domain-containing protein [Pseudonocardiaceae bacterium]